MNCRKNVSDLTSTEKAAFVQALIDLKKAPSQIAAAQSAGGQGRYDDYVWIHRQVLGSAHNAPAFTPWHREFLYQIERDLQTVSGNPDLTIPFWDWTKARTSSDPGWPFTNDLLGGLGTSAADSRVTTGRFATDPADPGATEWRINIPDVETDNFLKRRGTGLEFNLPTLNQARTSMEISTYDATPFVVSGFPTNTQLNASFRKFLEFVLHNGPHPWVGLLPQFSPANTLTNAPLVGSMTWQASPNDPTFWLHHCNIDRLWAVWQQRHGYPGYIPQSGGPSLQNGPNVMGMYNDSSFFNFPQHATPNSNENHKALGFMYPSDLPDISAPLSPSVNFGDVPEGLTTYKPVQFTITSCRPVKFRISAIGGSGYSDPYPGAHTVNPPSTGSPFTGDVYVAFQAPSGGSGPAAGSVTVEAFIEDPDRLLVPTAAPNDEFLIDSWTLNLSADIVSRPQAAVALALDRSGSMSLPAGGGLRRFDLMEGAVQVVSDLMRDTDALGLVYYDHTIAREMNITAMTAAGGQAQVAAALADPALEPAGGSTAIGNGMIEAADVLTDEMTAPGTPYSRFAMLVMTDGNENVLPYANQAPVTSAIASFSNDVYAVGLGHEGEVSDATLGAIANYMLITGDMNADEREFRLTKYFVQILAGITNSSIVVDPNGHLAYGMEHRIAFNLNSADLEADVITLSPLAFLIDMALEAPDGTLLTPGSLGPNSSFQRNVKDIFYRMTLPALPAQPDGTHGGKWTAVLSLSRDRIKDLSGRLERFPELFEQFRKGVIPYALTVQTYSNLSFDVRVEQPDRLPGGKLQLFAVLKQYNAPLAHHGRVRVEITNPARDISIVELHEDAPGSFSGDFQTTITGVYQCRFMASGQTLEGEDFNREQTRTAAVYRQLPIPVPPADHDDSRNDQLCDLLACLLREPGIRDLMERHKVSSEHIYECLRRFCAGSRKAELTRSAIAVNQSVDKQRLPADVVREMRSRMDMLHQGSGPMGILETPEPIDVPEIEEQDIPMNPLGGMWPMVETEDGDFVILLKTDEGRLDPPAETWKKEDEPDAQLRRQPKLPDELAARLKESSTREKKR